MEIARLHSAARRYCEERHDYWANEYSKILNGRRDRVGNSYTKEALSIFPRYNVLAAILEEIERFIPEDFADFDEARCLIALAGSTAENIFTKSPLHEIERQVMDEERESFKKYISEINKTTLEDIALMPFRRVLSEKESSDIWRRIRATWKIQKGCWYPLTESRPANAEVFQDTYFQENVSLHNLVKVLSVRGIERFWELNECRPDYEMATELFEPYYKGFGEGFWTSDSLDWIVYCSHEGSVTLGGWLLQEIKKLWPAWKEHIWTSPLFE